MYFAVIPGKGIITARAFLMNQSIKYLTLVFFMLGPLAQAQQSRPYLSSESFNAAPRNDNRFRMVFYNVENLFDYFNDSTTIDEEFLPRGGRYWGKKRYQDKQNKIAKTLIAIGGWEPPALIGLCEIENLYVLYGLTRFTQLDSVVYEFVHLE